MAKRSAELQLSGERRVKAKHTKESTAGVCPLAIVIPVASLKISRLWLNSMIWSIPLLWHDRNHPRAPLQLSIQR
jgi:hypothetical protein